VLEHLPEQHHPDLIIGFNQADDSGVVRLNEDTAMILTLDFFPAVVDDPFVFGQVAAANALSDIYAMGGRPLSALNIVGFPEGKLPIDVLEEMLKGGADKVNEAGAVIVGGHTVKDSELKYGLSVVGLIKPDDILTISGAIPGDRLVLTKPVGSGIYATALKKDALSVDDELLFYGVMAALNGAASEEMKRFDAHACTDVTGFGLLGHTLEMAESSGVTVSLDVDRLPVLPRALELAEGGYLTGGGMANREFVKDKVSLSGSIPPAMEMLLFDPQTSGGLLVAVGADRTDAYVAEIRGRGVTEATVIGEVLPFDKKRIILRR
jgi:selenide,water dikinase